MCHWAPGFPHMNQQQELVLAHLFTDGGNNALDCNVSLSCMTRPEQEYGMAVRVSNVGFSCVNNVLDIAACSYLQLASCTLEYLMFLIILTCAYSPVRAPVTATACQLTAGSL